MCGYLTKDAGFNSSAVTLQWIPFHCNVPGNETADSLAKEGTTKEQADRSTSYPEVKTILKTKQHSKWMNKHPGYSKADPYYLLTRRKQVTVFGLRTGHNRLIYHLCSKLRIGHTEQCPCGTGSQITEHLLQSCPIYEPPRKGIWPDHTPVARKLYGSLGDLRFTATFIEETGLSIWRTRRRKIPQSEAPVIWNPGSSTTESIINWVFAQRIRMELFRTSTHSLGSSVTHCVRGLWFLWATLQLLRQSDVTNAQSVVLYQKSNHCPGQTLSTRLTYGHFTARSKVQCAALCLPDFSCRSFMFDAGEHVCYLGLESSQTNCSNMAPASGLQHYDMVREHNTLYATCTLAITAHGEKSYHFICSLTITVS